MTTSPYEVFIPGETVNLVVPTEEAIEREDWFRWFNDPETTRYSDHGLFPNTAERQRQFLEASKTPGSDRLVLLIETTDEKKVIGVISLSNINWRARSAQVGMVIGSRLRGRSAVFHGIEAKARIAEHAFSVFGLDRVWGSQARPLADWQRFQTLFGFQVEGIMRRAFRRGPEALDLVITACLIDDYKRIVEKRGAYWPGKEALLDLMRSVSKSSPVDRIDAAIRREVEAYAKENDL